MIHHETQRVRRRVTSKEKAKKVVYGFFPALYLLIGFDNFIEHDEFYGLIQFVFLAFIRKQCITQVSSFFRISCGTYFSPLESTQKKNISKIIKNSI